MKKLDISNFNNIDFSSEVYKKLLSRLLDSSYIKELIDKHDITEKELSDESNIVELSRMLEINTLCPACQSIDSCKRIEKFKVLINRNIDSELEFIEYPCKQVNNIEKINSNNNYDNYRESKQPEIIKNLKLVQYFKKLKYFETTENLFISAINIDEVNYIAHNSLLELAKSKTIAYISFNDFLSDIKSMIQKKESYLSLLENISKVDYLYITNIGLERTSEFSRDEILLNILLNRKKNSTTIISSIYNINKLKEHFIAEKESYKNIKIERINNIITNLVNNIIEV